MNTNWKQNVTAALIAGTLTAVSTAALAEQVGTGLQTANKPVIAPAEQVGTGLQKNGPAVAPAEQVGTGVISTTATNLWNWLLFEIGA